MENRTYNMRIVESNETSFKKVVADSIEQALSHVCPAEQWSLVCASSDTGTILYEYTTAFYCGDTWAYVEVAN